jgi:hypothetical protein
MSMVVAVLLATALFAPPARAADDEGHSVIVWVGTVMTNLVYIPVKTVHAGLGGLVGGLGWLVTGGNTKAADGIFDHTIYSTWYVTPEILEGKEEMYFFGADD